MKKTQIIFSLILIVFCFRPSQCQTLRQSIQERKQNQGWTESEGPVPAPPDYSDLNDWAAHPWKWDYSDSAPAFLLHEVRDTSVDVFFLHPTTYTSNFENSNMNADVNDSGLNRKTDITTILYQASVFNGSCRVFAPRYRQAHLKAYFRLNSEESKKAFDLAYEDLKTAFQYYLDHWNNGRPIIIAAHSQGAMHAVRLLQEFFDGKPLQKQLVCAYVVGWQIKKDDFDKIPWGDLADQTGCVVGWRTYKKDKEDFLIRREDGNSLCVNPISWKTDNNWTPKEMHKGAVGKDFNKLVAEKISAEIAPGLNIVWVNVPDDIERKSAIASRFGNLHIADYNLFWMDIRENVKERIAAFFKQ